MFDREKFKDIIAEKDRMSWADWEDDYRMSKLCREMTDLIFIESNCSFVTE